MKRLIEHLRTVFLFSTLCCLSFFTMAQVNEGAAIDMADTMRSSGKIYVVVLVVLLVFGGLLLYAIRIDRKVTRLEQEMKEHDEKTA
jgi:hypothetical protein